jgi:hypothetical protein
VVGTERSREVNVPRAADGGHVGAERPPSSVRLGFSISRSSITSGEPNLSRATAFIVSPLTAFELVLDLILDGLERARDTA